jgi:hypothetical protein
MFTEKLPLTQQTRFTELAPSDPNANAAASPAQSSKVVSPTLPPKPSDWTSGTVNARVALDAHDRSTKAGAAESLPGSLASSAFSQASAGALFLEPNFSREKFPPQPPPIRTQNPSVRTAKQSPLQIPEPPPPRPEKTLGHSPCPVPPQDVASEATMKRKNEIIQCHLQNSRH